MTPGLMVHPAPGSAAVVARRRAAAGPLKLDQPLLDRVLRRAGSAQDLRLHVLERAGGKSVANVLEIGGAVLREEPVLELVERRFGVPALVSVLQPELTGGPRQHHREPQEDPQDDGDDDVGDAAVKGRQGQRGERPDAFGNCVHRHRQRRDRPEHGRAKQDDGFRRSGAGKVALDEVSHVPSLLVGLLVLDAVLDKSLRASTVAPHPRSRMSGRPFFAPDGGSHRNELPAAVVQARKSLRFDRER